LAGAFLEELGDACDEKDDGGRGDFEPIGGGDHG
jgi:hypothetical protein